MMTAGSRRFVPAEILCLFGLLLCVPLLAQEDDKAQKTDLAELCLKLAVIQEPEVDAAALESALKAIEDTARTALKEASSPAEKVDRLNRVLLKDRKVTYSSNKYWRDSTLDRFFCMYEVPALEVVQTTKDAAV